MQAGGGGGGGPCRGNGLQHRGRFLRIWTLRSVQLNSFFFAWHLLQEHVASVEGGYDPALDPEGLGFHTRDGCGCGGGGASLLPLYRPRYSVVGPGNVFASPPYPATFRLAVSDMSMTSTRIRVSPRIAIITL